MDPKIKLDFSSDEPPFEFSLYLTVGYMDDTVNVLHIYNYICFLQIYGVQQVESNIEQNHRINSHRTNIWRSSPIAPVSRQKGRLLHQCGAPTLSVDEVLRFKPKLRIKNVTSIYKMGSQSIQHLHSIGKYSRAPQEMPALLDWVLAASQNTPGR